MRSYLGALRLGEVRSHGPMSVFPVFGSAEVGPDYLTLSAAFRAGVLTVMEISQGGSVPQLKAQNHGEKPVLLLDGEEVKGAKQNRVLNTSILVPGKGEVVIPVSCTEAGRWAYSSPRFADSESVLYASLKEQKMEAVHQSLRSSGRFSSDQGAIWNNISQRHTLLGVHSPTGAMKDAYESRKATLQEYVQAFPLDPHQRGLLVFLEGLVLGMEMLSREGAYAELHSRLIESYALDAVARNTTAAKAPTTEQAQEFLKEITQCGEDRYKSAGMGWDHRFRGDRVVGSALVEDGVPVHLAFFRPSGNSGGGEGAVHLASARERMGFRRER